MRKLHHFLVVIVLSTMTIDIPIVGTMPLTARNILSSATAWSTSC